MFYLDFRSFFQQIFERIQRNESISLVHSYDEGVEKLLDTDGHDFGIIAESAAADYRKTKNCRLYTVGNLEERYYGLAVKRTASSFNEIKTLNKKILELYELGVIPMLINN